MWERIKPYLPQVGLLVIGTLLGVLFSAIVLFTEATERMAENSAKIEHNKELIDKLWEAHEIAHDETPGEE